MRVRINPDRLAADPNFRVEHPQTRRPFPSPKPFELGAADCANPRVLRLLPPMGQPGGVAGGVFGDLVPVPREDAAAPAKKSSGKEGV
ncbi:MAG: hypothetical protein IH626_05385 [Rhodospirillales bacterium]|nr:hypothetical protein [Rhodospirillales bacterium]